RRLGKIDMEGGLTTLLESVNDYHIEDPFTMAYHHYWSAPEPPVNSLSDAHRIAVPEKALFDQLGWGDRHEKIRKRVGDRIALIGDCSSATMAFYVCLRGIEKAMFDLIDQPELVHAVMEKGAAIAVAKGKYWIDRGLKILRLNDSVGNMSLISPEHWQQFVFPHMKTVCEELHAYDSGVRIYCHICGNILAIVEDLVKTGIDCIGPLDPLGGFTPADVKKRVQDSVSLMGGVNTLSFINNTPGEIIEEARRCIFQAGKKGGYILGSGCVVPRTCRKENLLALITASERYGVYHNGVLAGGKCQ
ncbi:uroporphyrinogen decarboxylase family protein, partial [bacterium]|nr:uroporphyrinogen decarboxylase family protein [bacterium]